LKKIDADSCCRFRKKRKNRLTPTHSNYTNATEPKVMLITSKGQFSNYLQTKLIKNKVIKMFAKTDLYWLLA